MKKLLLVIGTRPNYIKITQFKKVAQDYFENQFDIKILHTGQHFDKTMAGDFFEQLDIFPDYMLKIPQQSPANQIGEIIIRLETVIKMFNPNLVIVPGDVNSTLAAAITAHKMNVPLAHLESGLRSFDKRMPEEINRILVDEMTDLFFVTEESGLKNLIKEGKDKTKIHFVGNTMIDTLVAYNEDIESSTILKDYNLVKNDFILMTIHRPATVDTKKGILNVLDLLTKLTQTQNVVFPMHPRTLASISKFGLQENFQKINNLKITKPLDYFSFQNLIRHCKIVITDSGGIQEETTFKQKPCLTLRPNTERPSTIEIGTNTLLDFDTINILNHVDSISNATYKKGGIPEFWDGKATKRILQVLSNH